MGKFPLVAIAVFLVLVPFSHGKPTADLEQASFAKLSGKELVLQLSDDKKRPRVFCELARRAEPGEHADFSTFESKHYDLRLIVCPQEQPRAPIYLVLYGYINLSESNGGYRVDKASELFPPVVNSGPAEEEPAIQAFNSGGQEVKPFGGNNVLRRGGTLADINGDGIVERVDTETYGSEFNNATVLMVSAVKTKAQPLLTVVLNWGGDEWTFRLVDRDGDGISEIEAGPRTRIGLIPKAVWKWDRQRHAYAGPDGKAGDHFRTINGAMIWKELKRLKATNLTFPKDPDAIPARSIETTQATQTSTPVTPPSRSYRYSSLKNASDAEVLRFMAKGKSEEDREGEKILRNHLPENFWSTDAKAAALALVETNQSQDHRVHYQLAIDDRDKALPPAVCTVAFSETSPRDYNAIDSHYFLHVDPDESYLAYAQTWSAGVVFYNAVYDQPSFDMRFCRLNYEEARKIAEVIWWLNRVRSRVVKTSSSSATFSSADEFGRLLIRADHRTVTDHAGTLWGNFAARWTEDYEPETFLNFAAYLIADALPKRLGNAWTRFERSDQRDADQRQDSAPTYSDEERRRLQEISEQFLTAFSADQQKVSFSIVSVAVEFTGNFGRASNTQGLQTILAAMPSPAPPKRNLKQVFSELDKLSRAHDDNPKKGKDIDRRRAALRAEMEAIYYECALDDPAFLRRTISSAMQKLGAAADPERLSALAVSNSPEGQWALQRLSFVDRTRYAQALETLTHNPRDKWARQFFAELTGIDPDLARKRARLVQPDKKDPLVISAFLALREAGPVTDEAKWLTAIIEILHDVKADWEERGRAIKALVPEDAPLRYPGPEIDVALLKVFEPAQAGDSLNFTLEYAFEALARRGRTEYFERMADKLEATDEATVFDGMLSALAQLAQKEPARFNPRLIKIVRPHLMRTNKNLSGIFWTIWSSDLAGLKPDLERLATQTPDEYEDNKAHSYGGQPSEVTGHFHLARKILSLWSEPDPLIRSKLLVALCASEAEEFFRNPHPERVSRMKTDLNHAADELSPDAKNALREFISAIDSNPDSVDEGRVMAEMIHKATAFARAELRL